MAPKKDDYPSPAKIQYTLHTHTYGQTALSLVKVYRKVSGHCLKSTVMSANILSDIYLHFK